MRMLGKTIDRAEDSESPKCPVCGTPLMRDPSLRRNRWDCERCWVSFAGIDLMSAVSGPRTDEA